MSKISQDEFFNIYGKEKVVFDSYYKYKFCYKGSTKKGDEVIVYCGGDTDEIYRHNVSANIEEVVEELWPCFGYVYRDGEILHEFNDF